MLTDQQLAFLQLKKDLLYHKIPEAQVPYYVNEALRIGVETADIYQSFSLAELCQQLAVTVNHDDSPSKNTVRGEITIDTKQQKAKVTIHQSVLMPISQQTGLPYEKLADATLAHELYHLLDTQEAQTTNQRLSPITIFKLGKFKRQATILQTQEIAAHAFAKKMAQLSILPNAIDFPLLWEDSAAGKTFVETVKNEFSEIFT